MRRTAFVIAVLLLTAGCGGSGPKPGQANEPTSPHPATTKAPVASVAPCRDDDLRPRRLGLNGAMGTAYLTIALRHPGAGACTVQGYPVVRALDRGGTAVVDVRREPQGLDDRGPHVITVTRTWPAVVTVQWTLGHSCPSRTVDSLDVSLPGSSTTFQVQGFGTSSCNPGEGAAPIEVAPIQSAVEPADRAQALRLATTTARRLTQAYLDEWRTKGCVAASHRYLTRALWTSDNTGTPQVVSARVTNATLWSWTSANRYVVEMDLDLHFRGDPLAWNKGVNTRFVTVRPSVTGPRLALSTSP